MLFFLSIITIAITASYFYYVFFDKDCDAQFIEGCMSAGLSEDACKAKLYEM
jgi:hypothetical protein